MWPFFRQINPGHIHGDELVCLTEVAYDNLTRGRETDGRSEAGRRMNEPDQLRHSQYPLVSLHSAGSTFASAARSRCCEAAQQDVLLEILRQERRYRIRSTLRFCRHSLGHVSTSRQSRLPTTRDFEPFIQRIAAGEQGVLTAEPVLLLEPTSGSSAASKLIPYTKGLKRQFQQGIDPWIADLYRSFPSLMTGQSYWSVTPAARKPERTSGGIPVGFEDDSDYLGGFKGWLVRSVQAVPMEVKLIGDMESFWYVTLLFLLRSRRLALVSVWNPTFLTILCEHLHRGGRNLLMIWPPGP